MKISFLLNTSVLFLLKVLSVYSTPAATPEIHEYSALTAPLPLNPGQITNSFHKISIPKGPIAVYSFQADIVTKTRSGHIIPVPLTDAYLHHHVIYSNHSSSSSPSSLHPSPLKSHGHEHPIDGIARNIGFGAGTESRFTPQRFSYPYAFITMENEDVWYANAHIINTRGMTQDQAFRCVECPCHNETHFANRLKVIHQRGGNETTHHGRAWDGCNVMLLAQNNTSCRIDSYLGGLRCCADGDYCLTKTELSSPSSPTPTTYYLRYNLTYSKVTPANRPLELAACCDASGDASREGNVEYDVPSCEAPGCVRALSTIQMLHGMAAFRRFVQKFDESEETTDGVMVEVVFAVGHLHRGGMEMSLYDEVTGDLICRSVPRYGKSEGGVVGDEEGYIVEMTPCFFDPPLKMSTTHPLRVVSLYNATEAHTGVMGLFYIAISEVKEGDEEVLKKMAGSESGQSGSSWFLFFIFVVGIFILLAKRHKQKTEYTQIATMVEL